MRATNRKQNAILPERRGDNTTNNELETTRHNQLQSKNRRQKCRQDCNQPNNITTSRCCSRLSINRKLSSWNQQSASTPTTLGITIPPVKLDHTNGKNQTSRDVARRKTWILFIFSFLESDVLSLDFARDDESHVLMVSRHLSF